MAAQIPAAERLSAPPAWALACVPGLERGEPPRELTRLAGGSVNEVFRVDSPRGRFVLRLNGAAWRRPGVDRGRELTLQRAAAAAGISPAIVHANPGAQGLLITEYQEGRLWCEQDYEDVPALRRLGERLHALHGLSPPDVPDFDPWSVAQDYVRQINNSRPSWLPPEQLVEPLARLQRTCAALGETSSAASIVHGDLAQSNLLDGSQLWLLDWEYAQRSDPLMDLACVLAYYPAAQRHGAELAAAAGLSAAAQGEGLAQRVYIYRALAWLWHLARGERSSAP
jgi:thiamine kinase-like enzyme